MNICRRKACGIEYDVKETIRSFGDMVWTGLYCSAQCYTKALMEKPFGLVGSEPVPIPNVIYLVIRHQGQHDDYRSDPVKAFKDEEKAKEFISLCNEEAKRIREEIQAWKDIHADLFKLPEFVEISEDEDEDEYFDKIDKQFENEHKDGVLFFEKVIEIYNTHKYDSDITDHDDLHYNYIELELE